MKRLLTAIVLSSAAASAVLAADERNGMPYVPGLGEFMMANQMHHAKLWFAGSAGNWELAAYELDELKEGFDDAARLYPEFKGMPVGAMIRQNLDAPLAELQKAIQSKRGPDFERAFDRLTAACNTCHAGAAHGFIRITRPTVPPISNQVYAPD